MFVVTGASTGIGRATAESLAELECPVLAVARRKNLLDDLRDLYPNRISVLATDLASEQGLDALEKALCNVHNVLGVVHAAGTLIPAQHYQKLTSVELLNDMQVHVGAPIEINKRLFDKLQGGKVLYIDSFSAHAPRKGWAGYSIVKAAAQMAARAAAEELRGIDIIRVFPGAVKTPLVDALLNSVQPADAKALFASLAEQGSITEPSAIGRYIASILLRASEAQLMRREVWDYSNPKDRLF